jgi:hypothetical protein
MQGTRHNVESIQPDNDDQRGSKESETQGSTAGAREAPTGPTPEGGRGKEAGTDEEGSSAEKPTA